MVDNTKFDIMLLVLAASGLITWKLSQNSRILYVNKEAEERRNYDEPMCIDCWKGYGEILARGGHPDELDGLKNQSIDLSDLRDNYFAAEEFNKKILKDYYYNPDIIYKKSLFSGPSDEVVIPTMSFASPWFSWFESF